MLTISHVTVSKVITITVMKRRAVAQGHTQHHDGDQGRNENIVLVVETLIGTNDQQQKNPDEKNRPAMMSYSVQGKENGIHPAAIVPKNVKNGKPLSPHTTFPCRPSHLCPTLALP